MDISNFGSETPGKLIEISGITNASHSFIPNSLPPKWDWPNTLWPLLLEARTSLASLDGIGKHLPNPQLLLRPLQNREALKSSSLEGTYTIPEKQLLFQMNPKEPLSETDPLNAYKEVSNYGKALQLHLEHKDSLPISLRLIRKLHETLMNGVRGSDKEPGVFRKLQVQIGRPPRYVPPPPLYLITCLDALEKYLHQEIIYDPLVNTFLVHYQFEAIHPFRDGNGRVGRLLLTILIAEWCKLSNQWLHMSAFFEKNKDDYIDHLFSISSQGRWKDWIEFCLHGVIEQAKDTERRCEKLIALSDEFKNRIKPIKGSNRLNMISDELFISPVINIPYLSEEYNVTYPTARADVDKLNSVKILTELSGIGQKTYYCPEILNITYSDDTAS